MSIITKSSYKPKRNQSKKNKKKSDKKSPTNKNLFPSPSRSKSASELQEHKETKLCGLCNKKLNQEDKKNDIKSKCKVCNDTYDIKTNCATILLAQATNTTVQKTLDKSVFEKTTIPLYCHNCKEACFYCNKLHPTSCK